MNAPPKRVSPFSKIKIGSRRIFRMPPMTNTHRRYLAEWLKVKSSALKKPRIGFIHVPRIKARTAVTQKLAQKPKEDAFFAVSWSFLPRLRAITLLAPMPNRFATAVSRVKMGKVMDNAAS